MSNKNTPQAAQGASVAKKEEATVLTVSSRKEHQKSLDSVISKLAELKKAEKFHGDISEKITGLQSLQFEEGNRSQSLTIVDIYGNNFTVYAEGFLTKVVQMLLEQANVKKTECEEYLLSASI